MQQQNFVDMPHYGYGVMRIIYDSNTLKDTNERMFPASRHRSKRIHKKLIKRFGSEFRKVPAMFRVSSDVIVAHPALRKEIERIQHGYA